MLSRSSAESEYRADLTCELVEIQDILNEMGLCSRLR